MKLKMLKPLLSTQPTALRAYKAGDDRIRGSALQRIRHRILTRDCGLCQCEQCKAPGAIRQMASVVDHIVPLWAGGREDDSNRQALSVECHKRKSDAETKQRGG